MSTPDDTAREALTALGLGPAAKELYVDLIGPTAREMGGNLLAVAKLISVAMAPLHGMVWGLEKVRDWLAAALLKRLADVNPDDIQTPPPYIAGQVLMQLRFCADQEKLRELYANLLASAMQRDKLPGVHPAFATIIEQLTPDEAVILQGIADNHEDFEFQEVRNERGHSRGQIAKEFRKYCSSITVTNIDASTTYLDNLLRLKLFEEVSWAAGLPQHRRFVPPPPSGGGGFNFPRDDDNTTMRVVRLSAFGTQFLSACVRSETKTSSTDGA